MINSIGMSEVLVILTLMIVLFKPKDLPRFIRAFRRAGKKLEQCKKEARKLFDEIVEQAELPK